MLITALTVERRWIERRRKMISVDTLTELAKKNAIGRSATYLNGWADGYWLLRLAIEVIKQDPLPYKNMDEHDKVQDIEVVHCKDCKWWNTDFLPQDCGWCEKSGNEHGRLADWFCADGERRDPCSSQDS
jgi:hypothetical protein